MAVLISEYVAQCLQGFQAATLRPHELSDVAHQKLLDEFARFKLWTGNIGAHRRGRCSLDWRLRDASHLRDLVVNLLTDLKSALHDALSMLDKNPNTHIEPVGNQNDVLMLDDSLNPDDFDEVDDDTEILEITADISDIMGCLSRLSVSIRNPAPHDHFMSFNLIDTSHFEEYDVAHVEAKLSDVSPALAQRLGKAISRRRQYFKYRESHHQKLATPLDLDSRRSEVGVQSTVASSIPIALRDGEGGHPAFSRIEEEDMTNSGASQTSYATSGPASGRLKMPSFPKQARDGPFECPFCYMRISVSTTIQWKRHVNADLRPYICLEPDCLTSEQQYAKRHEWLNHLNQKHWRVFKCPYSCQEADFNSHSQLERHLRQSHPELSSQRDLSMVFDLCERPSPWPEESECPLCQQTLNSKREYARHVGQHQIELALFALPNNRENDEDEEDSSDGAPQLDVESHPSEEWSASEGSKLSDSPEPEQIPVRNPNTSYGTLDDEIQRMVKGAPLAIASQQSTTVLTGSAIQHDQAKQKRHWVVPFGRNRQFVGRESILEQLLAMIFPSIEENNCQRTAIEGLGGVGKTQIALEAGFQVRDMHLDCSIFWVPAVDITSFENAYRKIGQELGIKGIDEDKADVKLIVKEALNRESAGRWLLIIDNADDVELFSGNANLSMYLPSSYKGSILFTTRDHKTTVELSATSITVGKLERGESLKLLETSLKKAQLRNPEDTTKLLDFLEDLPLAIKQASAYMATVGISTTKYLDFCQSSEADAMSLLSEDSRDLYRYNETPNPVVKTFRISFKMISQSDPLAADYLRFISFLSDKDIPRSLLPPAEKIKATEAIGTLKEYAFVTEQEEGHIYDIHRLTRLSILNWLTITGGRQEWATKVSQQLANVIPLPLYENKIIWTRYLPHAQNLTKFLADTNDTTAKVMLLWKLGRSLLLLGRYEEAEDMLRRLLDLAEEVQGETVVDKLSIMSDLAWALNYQGQREAAEKILRETLARRQATHKTLASTMNDMRLLAEILTHQQNFEESESIHWQTLRLAKEILDGERPGSCDLDARTTNLDKNAGHMFYEEAKNLCQQAHEIDRDLEAQTMHLMASFAKRLQMQRRYEEAEQTLRQLLPLVRTSLGSDGILVISTMVQLGMSLSSQGKSKSKEAVEILRQALFLNSQVQGEAHPDTLSTMGALGIALRKESNPKEALTILRQTLVLQQQVQNEAHPNTLITMHQIGITLYEEGNPKEAINILRQTFVLEQKVRGETHPFTLNTMRHLAIALTKEGNLEEAATLICQTLVLDQKVRGEAHSATLDTMRHLAIALYKEGNPKEAAKILRQAQDLIQQNVGGKAYRGTQNILEWLDFILRNTNSDAED